MRNTLKIGLVVLVVAALATTGIALALGDEADDTAATPQDHVLETLAPLVEDGTITQAQADAVAEVLAERAGEFRGRHGDHLEEIAGFLGVTSEEIREALRDGGTLGEIAEASGSSADALIAFMVEEASARLDEAIADGRITEEEAAQRLAEITDRITEGVTEGFDGPMGRPGFGPGPGRPGHHHGGFGRPFGGGDTPEADTGA